MNKGVTNINLLASDKSKPKIFSPSSSTIILCVMARILSTLFNYLNHILVEHREIKIFGIKTAINE